MDVGNHLPEKRHRIQMVADALQVFEMEDEPFPMRSFNNTKSVERIIYGIITYVLNNPTDMPNP
jgi:hypothetical protein